MVEFNIHPYCNCMTRGTWQKQDGYTLDPPSGLWVHARCRKPSMMNYQRMISGRPQIPHSSRIEDIYELELKADASKVARKEIAEELDWSDDDDDFDY